MRRLAAFSLALALALGVAGCGAADAPEPAGPAVDMEGAEGAPVEVSEVRRINVEVNGVGFTATLESNAAADALLGMLPLTLSLSDYAGFEKVGPLGARLPADNRQTTTSPGDIVLYNGNQIVMFYGSNSWSYTPLARIENLEGWAEALGGGNVKATLSAAD